MVLLTQHYDTVASIGSQSKATILMIPYTPDGMHQVGEQITQALLTTNEAMKPTKSEQSSAKPPTHGPKRG